MILCDLDGVVAVGPEGDTKPGAPIYRTFAKVPSELETIGAAEIPLHLVTAKVEPEARQVLEAIGLDHQITSVLGANRLFWPSIWVEIRRRGRLPRSIRKSVCRRVLRDRDRGSVVMLEDRLENLEEMLAADAIDHGILIPPLRLGGDRVLAWFELDLALRIARELATGKLEAPEVSRLGISVYRWRSDRLEPVQEPLTSVQGPSRYVLRLPSRSYGDDPTAAPTLEALDTGRVLAPGRPTVVGAVRAGRRALRFLAGHRGASL